MQRLFGLSILKGVQERIATNPSPTALFEYIDNAMMRLVLESYIVTEEDYEYYERALVILHGIAEQAQAEIDKIKG